MTPPVGSHPFSRLVAETLHEDIELRDGRRVQLRPIRPDDAHRLVDLHGRSSPQSRYFRLFRPSPELSMQTAEYFANVDFRTRFAIVATVEEEVECVIAVARFDLMPDEAVAELALVVRDDYQGAGLGTALFRRLVDLARARGVRRLTGQVLAENHRMRDLLRAQGIRAGAIEAGVLEFGVPVDDPPSVLSLLGILARNGE